MALNLSIDLSDASFGDLVALVDAARSAGMDPNDEISFDGTTLSLSVDVDAFFPSFADRRDDAGGELIDPEDLGDEDFADTEVLDDDEYFGPPFPRGDHQGPRRSDRGGRDRGRGERDRDDRGQYPRSPFEFMDTSGIGDAAIRSVIDILTGRQEPPRGRR